MLAPKEAIKLWKQNFERMRLLAQVCRRYWWWWWPWLMVDAQLNTGNSALSLQIRQTLHGIHQKKHCQRIAEFLDSPLLRASESALKCWVLFCTHVKKDVEKMQRVQHRAVQMAWDLVHDQWGKAGGAQLAKGPMPWSNSCLQVFEGQLQIWWSQTVPHSARWCNEGLWSQFAAWDVQAKP